MKLEETPVAVRFFCDGSVEEIESLETAENLTAAKGLVRNRHPQAMFVPCCEDESDGGCVFIYPNEHALRLDEDQMRQHTETGEDDTPEGYGRWVGLVTSAESDEPACSRPRNHSI